MEFSFCKQSSGELILGLHRKGRHSEITDIEECLIFSQEAMKISRKILQFLKIKNISAYDIFTREGFLRHMVLRESKFLKQLMINIVTTSKGLLPVEELLDYLKEELKGDYIKSIIWTINDSLSDAVISQDEKLLWGQRFITEKIDSLYFRIYPYSFFQTNSYGVSVLYKKISDLIKDIKACNVLDLYCGSGGISLYIHKHINHGIGVELNKEAIDNAFENLKINKVENINFFNADVKRFLIEKKGLLQNIDTVIVNPPRPGISKKVLKRILDLNPHWVIYISCNPKTVSENLSWLDFNTYRIKAIYPIDLFPHTSHLECIALIEKK